MLKIEVRYSTENYAEGATESFNRICKLVEGGSRQPQTGWYDGKCESGEVFVFITSEDFNIKELKKCINIEGTDRIQINTSIVQSHSYSVEDYE